MVSDRFIRHEIDGATFYECDHCGHVWRSINELPPVHDNRPSDEDLCLVMTAAAQGNELPPQPRPVIVAMARELLAFRAGVREAVNQLETLIGGQP